MKPFMRAVLGILAVGVLALPAGGEARGGPGGASPRLTASELREDFGVLREALEALHPGLYRYNSKPEMDAHFAALQRALARDQTLPEAYLALSVFLAKIRCGHTYPNFVNQTKAVAQALFHHRDRLPFYFCWVDERMVVTRDLSSDARLRVGAEILAINGVPTSTILRRLMTIARADGSNDAKRVSSLEVSGLGRYEAFDVYFPLFFPSKSATLRLLVRPEPTARPRLLQVQALSHEERLASRPASLDAGREGNAPVWELKHLEPGTALLRMPTWALYDSPWDWKGFLAGMFSELEQRQVSHLILDLRGNEGGLDAGDPILSRLIREDLRLAQFKRLVRYRRVPETLAPHLDTWDPSFKDWGEAAVEPAHGFFTLKKYDDDARGNVITPVAPPYRGRVSVLVDAANSSATFQFAQVLQQNKLATLVGQPTGGNQRGINGGAFFFLRLPRSGIEVDLPLIGLYPSEDKPDAGLTPDVLVKPRVEDIARGVDAELERAKSLVPPPP